MDASALNPVRTDTGALLAGRVAVISGAGRAKGIGKATARLFMSHGARVALLDVNAEEAHAAAADLNDATGTDHARGWACDVASAAACASAIDGVLAWSGGTIDILVNNAGLTQKRGIAEVTEADYDTVTDVVLRGTLLLSQAALPAMRARHGGSIVNVSSMSAQQGGGIFGGAHYCAAKAGVLGLTRAMARELGTEGIRVNAIAPGLILTDFSRTGRSDADKHASGAGWPLPRAGHAAEIAGTCLFLASDLSSYVTGTTIDVNGGAHMR
ncbi:MAG: SDR family oxidoreductase [Proteobacteria bacterium]|nr:SDR family oxidoreductase [Pseudomonadota bacterium]